MAAKPKRYLLGVDTREMPGKVVLTFVSFHREVAAADDPAFLERRFELLDPELPEARSLRKILPPAPKPEAG